MSSPSTNKGILLWSGFLSVSFVVYYFISSGDYSFLLTFASFMRCFGFMLLTTKIWSAASMKGISVKTLELYLLVFLFRLLSIMRFQGYLPYDQTGDWFYHLVELLSFGFIALCLFGAFTTMKFSYDQKYDTFGNLHIPAEYGGLYLLVPTLVLAAVVHPSLNSDWFSDVCWTTSMYLESVAMFPQLFMFQKLSAEARGSWSVEDLLGHFVFALGFSRMFEFLFWGSSYRELLHYETETHLAGYFVLIAQLMHLVIMADFFYYYIKAMVRGTSIELPIAQSYSGLV